MLLIFAVVPWWTCHARVTVPCCCCCAFLPVLIVSARVCCIVACSVLDFAVLPCSRAFAFARVAWGCALACVPLARVDCQCTWCCIVWRGSALDSAVPCRFCMASTAVLLRASKAHQQSICVSLGVVLVVLDRLLLVWLGVGGFSMGLLLVLLMARSEPAGSRGKIAIARGLEPR